MSDTGRPFPFNTSPRTLSRWLALAFAIALAALTWRGQVIVPALSPFIALTSLAALRVLGALLLLALPALVLMLVVNRGFCRYVCPVGLLEEKLGRLRPSAAGWGARCPRIGVWTFAMTVVGALFGYPLFLWLDPLAIFNGFFSALHLPLSWAAVLSGLGLPLVLLVSFLVPNAWCGRICPLGAMQDALTLLRRLGGRGFRQAIEPPSPQRQTNDGILARRLFLGAGAGAIGALAAKAAGSQSSPPLRPPGAAKGLHFVGLCVRCGNCVRCCPSKIIAPDLSGQGGLPGLLAPKLRFDKDYCREDCHACGQACPSGAIARLPLSEKRRQRIGLAKIDLGPCLRAQGRECRVCEERCPERAITMESSADGFDQFPVVDPALCNGCGACEAFCPARCCAVK